MLVVFFSHAKFVDRKTFEIVDQDLIVPLAKKSISKSFYPKKNVSIWKKKKNKRPSSFNHINTRQDFEMSETAERTMQGKEQVVDKKKRNITQHILYEETSTDTIKRNNKIVKLYGHTKITTGT